MEDIRTLGRYMRQKHKVVNVLVGFLVSVSIISISLWVSANEYWDKYQEENRYGYYRVIDNQMEGNGIEYALKLIELNQLMHGSKNGTYVEVYNQPIALENGIANERIFGILSQENRKINFSLSDRGCFDEVPCVWVGSNVAEEFGVGMNSGEWFDKKGYEYDPEKTVPIILGSWYSDLISLGTEVRIDTFVGNKRATVIGFLKEDACIVINDTIVNLNGYVLIPSFCATDNVVEEIRNMDPKEVSLLKHLYWMKMDGQYGGVADINILQKEINDMFEAVDLPNPSQVGMNPYTVSYKLGVSLHSIFEAIKKLGVILALFAVCLVSVSIYSGQKKEGGIYALLFLSGYSVVDIAILSAIQFFPPTAMAAFFSVPPSMILSFLFTGGPPSYGSIIWLSLTCFAVEMMTAMLLWGKANMVYYLQENT